MNHKTQTVMKRLKDKILVYSVFMYMAIEVNISWSI